MFLRVERVTRRPGEQAVALDQVFSRDGCPVNIGDGGAHWAARSAGKQAKALFDDVRTVVVCQASLRIGRRGWPRYFQTDAVFGDVKGKEIEQVVVAAAGGQVVNARSMCRRFMEDGAQSRNVAKEVFDGVGLAQVAQWTDDGTQRAHHSWGRGRRHATDKGWC